MLSQLFFHNICRRTVKNGGVPLRFLPPTLLCRKVSNVVFVSKSKNRSMHLDARQTETYFEKTRRQHKNQASLQDVLVARTYHAAQTTQHVTRRLIVKEYHLSMLRSSYEIVPPLVGHCLNRIESLNSSVNLQILFQTSQQSIDNKQNDSLCICQLER